VGKVFANRGSLVASFSVPLEGKRIRWRYFFGLPDTRDNRRKADAIAKEIREMIAAGQWAELAVRFHDVEQLERFRRQGDVTLGELADRYLKQQGSVGSKGTIAYYRAIFKSYVWSSPLADKPVTAGDLVLLFGEIKQKGFEIRANKVREALSALFNYARNERGGDGAYLIDDNPVRRTKPLRVTRGEDIDPFTREETQQIIEAAKDGWEHRLVTVAFGTGLRPGELFGLKRENVDLSARVIYVRQSLSRFGEGPVKTPRSRRTVDMAESVYRALKEQLDSVQLRSERVWYPRADPHSSRTFSNRTWPAILKRACVKHREFYQCRHTFATLHLKRGTDVQYIADQMGHANLIMLQKHYWKWRPGAPVAPKIDILSDAAPSSRKKAL
jgi:integrase